MSDTLQDGLHVVCCGRIGVDLYPTTPGPLTDVGEFGKSLGGSATNVAVAVARLGLRSALVSAVGDDGMGEYARSALRDFGVDDRWVATRTGVRTPIVVAELDPPEEPRLHFYRDSDAPDMTIEDWQIDEAQLARARMVWITGTGLSTPASRAPTLSLLRAGGNERVFDLDWRPQLWLRPDEAPDAYREALAHTTVAIGGRAECQVVVGAGTPEQQAERLHELGPSVVVVKCGGEGTFVSDGTRGEFVPATQVDVVCGLGAGDAFGGAFAAEYVIGADPFLATRVGSAAGAIVASRLACADAMPTLDEIDAVMEDAHVAGNLA